MKKTFPITFIASLTVFAVTAFTSLLAAGGETEFASFPVPVEWHQEQAAAIDIKSAKQPIVIVKITGQEEPVILPMSMDTSLLNKGDKSQNEAGNIQVRFDLFSQALLKPDLSALRKNAKIESAQLRLSAGWQERPGSATLELHRMLTDWQPAATWIKPSPDQPKTWNGMVKGVDYEAEPFATFKTAMFKPGPVTIDNMGPAIEKWVSGAQPNYGFVIQLSGNVNQINFSSRIAKADRQLVRELTVGKPSSDKMTMVVDLGVLRRLILSSGDIHGAQLRLTKTSATPISNPAGIKVENAPEAKVSIDGDSLVIGGLDAPLRQMLESQGATAEFTISFPDAQSLVFGGPDGGKEKRPSFSVDLPKYQHAEIFDYPRIRPGVYTTVKDGHLFYGDQRLRLWGTLGHGSPVRLREMGFNGFRLWPTLDKAYTEADAAKGEFVTETKGDNSELDKFDRTFAGLKEQGFYIMATPLMGMMPVKLLAADGSFVSGGDDWEQWKQAVAKGGSWSRYSFVDERLEKARKQHARNVLNHVNPYTGKRYGEDEAVAIWELDNECGFANKMLSDDEFDRWPDYFKNKLQKRWNDWLRKQYKSDAGLNKAWGKLNAGESLGSVKLGPDLKTANQFPKARGNDFVHFILDVTDEHYQDLRGFCRSQAPAGAGAAIAPYSFDTQYRPSLPWAFASTRGDVSNFGMYFWGLTSTLATPPSAYVMDSNTVEGKPTVIYETNQSRPDPYRAEYPYKLAAMASLEDWDAIFFHFWYAWDTDTDESFMMAPMQHGTPSSYWEGVHHQSDPAMTSAMALAGRIFLNRAIKPEPQPAIYRVGKQGIYSYDFINGLGMGRDTFARGSRIRFEPDKDFKLQVENSSSDPHQPITGAVKSSDEVTWDWPNGRLIIDAPGAKAFVGKVPNDPWTFRDGITLSGLSTPWVAFGLVSADGKPLVESSQEYVGAMFDARNTGFKMDWNVSGGPVEQARGIKDYGHAPAIVDKVDYTLSYPHQLEWQFQGYDFALRKIVETKGQSNVIRMRNAGEAPEGAASNPHTQEVWMGVLNIASRNGEAKPVVDANPGAQKQVAAGGSNDAEASDPALAAVWNPLPGLSWGDHYGRTHRTLRDAAVRFSSITPEDRNSPGEKTITWSDAEALFDSPATIEVGFRDGAMRKIVATFVRPPDLRTAVDAYEKQFGAPAEKKIVTNQYEQSSVRWVVKNIPGNLEIIMTDAQGTMKISYEFQRAR